MLELAPRFDAGRPPMLLCIGAHSDDIEIGCGASVLTLLERYPEMRVEWVVLAASGERAGEARRSAERFLMSAGSGSIRVESFRERYFPFLPEIKEYFDELGRHLDPDLVLVPWMDDMHQDHRTVGELARTTFRDHLLLHYEIPKYDGDMSRPNVYVPVSASVADRKIDALFEGFPSQVGRDWFHEETFRGLMRLRGVECKAPEGYAEAFHGRKLLIH